jgi:hypothetical protein
MAAFEAKSPFAKSAGYSTENLTDASSTPSISFFTTSFIAIILAFSGQ